MKPNTNEARTIAQLAESNVRLTRLLELSELRNKTLAKELHSAQCNTSGVLAGLNSAIANPERKSNPTQAVYAILQGMIDARRRNPEPPTLALGGKAQADPAHAGRATPDRHKKRRAQPD